MRLFIVVILFLLPSCTPAKFQPFIPPTIEFESTVPYSIKENIESLPKPEKLKKIWVKAVEVDGNRVFVNTSSKEGTHLLLTKNEYAKVGVLVKRSIALKEIALEQENLINFYIDQLNSVKSLFALESKKSSHYRELWVASENAFRKEKAQHKLDNWINRVSMYLITVGSIIVLILAI
jgi:hypothetical protein